MKRFRSLSTLARWKLLKTGGDLPSTAEMHTVVVIRSTDDFEQALRYEERIANDSDIPSSDATVPMSAIQKRKIIPVRLPDFELAVSVSKKKPQQYSKDLKYISPPVKAVEASPQPTTSLRSPLTTLHQEQSTSNIAKEHTDSCSSFSDLVSPTRWTAQSSSRVESIDLDSDENRMPLSNILQDSQQSPKKMSPKPPIIGIECQLLAELVQEVKRIHARLDRVERTLHLMRAESNAIARSRICPVQIALPVKTLDDLYLLEEELNNTEKSDDFETYLTSCGGESIGDAIRAMVRMVLTSSLCHKLNWNGVHGRTALGTSNVTNCILNAVHKLQFSSFTREDASKIMKRFIQRNRY